MVENPSFAYKLNLLVSMFISFKLVRNFKFSAKNSLTLIIQSMEPVEYFYIYYV
jgi:hypothetical protein